VASKIEHKFIVKSDEWRRLAGKGVPYRQGYLAFERTVRVRPAGACVEPESAARDEFEYPIPVKDGRYSNRSLVSYPYREWRRS
jgi:adenylate cyclase